MKSIGVLWAQYGPYHFARVAALKKLAGPEKVHALELANHTADYEWQRSPAAGNLITICPGAQTERLPFWRVFQRTRRSLADLKLEVCFLPSYSPKQSLAALLAAKSLGIRTVMMNESHAGTARAQGGAAWVKRRLVSLFDAALVGGLPQKRYFAGLGLPTDRIFTGYDAVDNDYFVQKTAEARGLAPELRKKYGLPDHYFLSLGRFVAKKNTETLIRAFRKLLDADEDCRTHLVMVGSGEEEPRMRSLCQALGLPVFDKTAVGRAGGKAMPETGPPGVHFYGFRQIAENPVFYGLADAFVLPSLWEEWGLVVNEAMASGLPVVVSASAGCSEDLVKPGWPVLPEGTTAAPPSRWANFSGRVGRNGFVFDPKSSESLALALLALASAPALREEMGRAGREIIQEFSCEAFARNALLAANAANN